MNDRFLFGIYSGAADFVFTPR